MYNQEDRMIIQIPDVIFILSSCCLATLHGQQERKGHMEVFEIGVNLKTDDVKLFVVPFEIQSTDSTVGYLLVQNEVSLGSIYLGENYQWTSNERLPWDEQDLQRIGKEIESLYFLFRD